MRDIVTSVSYQDDSSSQTTTSDMSLDMSKLTATNWQPATDWRRYEQQAPKADAASLPGARRRRVAPDDAQLRGRLHSSLSSASKPSVRSSQRQDSANESDAETNDDYYDDDESSQSTNHQSEVRSRTSADPSRDQIDNWNRIRAARLAATGGPAIVRHQASSSRRLLRQLARLRQLSEPRYSVRRPAKVAQFERLIEQLERATSEWDEDELLLERAERRDWPAEYQRRFGGPMNQAGGHELADGLPGDNDFGRRRDVEPLEEEAIIEAHESQASRARTWNSMPRARPAPTADRYADDLAVRRLTGPPSRASPAEASPQMSYLLCTSAYAPSGSLQRFHSRRRPPIAADLFEGPPELEVPLDGELEWRLLEDDLHFRGVNPRRLVPHEPPFGIPRQPSSHSTAGHPMRRSQREPRANHRSSQTIDGRIWGGASQTKVGACGSCPPSMRDGYTPTSERATPTPDIKTCAVCSPGGRVSADSGVGRQSAASRLTPASPFDDSPRVTELERHRARIQATPVRSRPSIRIENPRSKSPLLKTAPAKPQTSSGQKEAIIEPMVQVQCYTSSPRWARSPSRATSELECRYEFRDDDEDELELECQSTTTRTPVVVLNEEANVDTDSSLERRLNHRGIGKLDLEQPVESQKQSAHEAVGPTKPKPMFRIGQWEPSESRSNLKIL